MLLLVLAFAALTYGQGPAFVKFNFGKWPANLNNNTLAGNLEINICPELSTSYTRVNMIPFNIDGNGDYIVTLQTPGLTQQQACTVTVRESSAIVKRQFSMFAGETYEWNDLTARLTVHIEWWNPWCELSPINNANGLVKNGARLVLNVRNADDTSPTAFRQYSDKPVVCGDDQLSWSYFPSTPNGQYFGQSCDENGGAFTSSQTVWILKVNEPVTVYAEEYRNGDIVTQSDCDPQAWTLGHDGDLYGPNSAPRRSVSVDTSCGDGSCNSGILIARLQIPNWCIEPNPQSEETLGQYVWNNGNDQFPATSLLLTFRTGTQILIEKPVRWWAGVPNSRIDTYVIANNVYEVGAQFPAATAPTDTLRTGDLIKVPTASCYDGSCEAQPITSTLYLDTQGHCEDIRDISISQQSYDQQGRTPFFQNYRPNCNNLTNDHLVFCVFNLRNTEITVEYDLHGTANTVDVELPTIDCQNTAVSQRCDSVGGIAELCPDWGCIADVNGMGPTQLNIAVTYNRGGSDYVLNHQVASPADLVSNHNGCLWIPALPETKITVAEGCCQYPVLNGNNDGGFTGCGCVQHSLNTTTCSAGGSCTTEGSFGRLLTVFDVAYLPEEPNVATTSVGLEAVPNGQNECCPFRFKTQQGGSPQCYCVLPIELKARIIETNLETRAQACKCTQTESCVVRYADRQSDCSICDFLSAFHFDLTGLPRWTTATLYVGPDQSTSSQDEGMRLLRQYNSGVGGLDNWKSVLRNSDVNQGPCCENQTYCLSVSENAATLERCIQCTGKICEPKEFTRSLCLDLENPCPDGSITGLLDVAIFTQGDISSWPASNLAPVNGMSPESWVRTVKAQGGVNGCAAPTTTKRSEQADAETIHQHDPELLLSMTEEELIDYESEQAALMRRNDDRRARTGVLTSVNSGRYQVLAIPYTVAVFEQQVRVAQDTDCTHLMMNPAAQCNATNFLNCMCWNTTCTGNAIGSSGLNGGGIPSDNIWVTLGYGDGQSFGQIRGPRGYWSQDLETCSWSRATWVNATWERAGNQYKCVPVLQASNLALRVEEGLILPPAPRWPDPRGHPTVTVYKDCSYPTLTSGPFAGFTCRQRSLYPPCQCQVTGPEIFSLWEIISVRGIPSQGSQLVFKYTRPDQTQTSNQGVFRNVPADRIAVGSGLESDESTWRPAYNWFCMVADPLYAFSFNWGDFAYPWFNGELQPNPNAIITNFNCDANVAPYAQQLYDWQEGLNLCRGCAKANVDNGVLVDNPCLYTETPTTAGRVCNTGASLSPSGSYIDTTTPNTLTEVNSGLCRVAWVLTGSDNINDHPWGTIFKLDLIEGYTKK